MEKRWRYALIGGIAAALLVIAAAVAWQVSQRRAEQAFIAEQYAQLEEDKAALEQASAGPDGSEVGAQCQAEWERSDRVRDFWEVRSVTTSEPKRVADGLYSISGHVAGTDGQKDIESDFSCTAHLDGDEWVVELL